MWAKVTVSPHICKPKCTILWGLPPSPGEAQTALVVNTPRFDFSRHGAGLSSEALGPQLLRLQALPRAVCASEVPVPGNEGRSISPTSWISGWVVIKTLRPCFEIADSSWPPSCLPSCPASGQTAPLAWVLRGVGSSTTRGKSSPSPKKSMTP